MKVQISHDEDRVTDVEAYDGHELSYGETIPDEVPDDLFAAFDAARTTYNRLLWMVKAHATWERNFSPEAKARRDAEQAAWRAEEAAWRAQQPNVEYDSELERLLAEEAANE